MDTFNESFMTFFNNLEIDEQTKNIEIEKELEEKNKFKWVQYVSRVRFEADDLLEIDHLLLTKQQISKYMYDTIILCNKELDKKVIKKFVFRNSFKLIPEFEKFKKENGELIKNG